MSPQLSKWEYLEVFVDGAAWRDGGGRAGTLPASLLEGTASGAGRHDAAAAAVASQLGKGGWALTSTIPGRTTSKYRLVFRRLRGGADRAAPGFSAGLGR